jgi:hypothetical protein
MMVISLSFIIYHLSFSPVTAQTFTQNVQKGVRGEGVVTIHQDKSIDELVNGTSASQVSSPNKLKQEKKTSQPVSKEKTTKEAKKENRTDQKADSSSQTANESAVHHNNDSLSTIQPTHSYKVMGFRVQAFAGGNSRKDRQKAEQTGNQLRSLFPNEQVYTHFYSPRWICRIGNYRTYEEAHQMLEEVKKLGYTSATIVKGKISVAY